MPKGCTETVYHDARMLAGDGILYDSVRHRDPSGQSLGECAAAFGPPALRNAKLSRTMERHWDGNQISNIQQRAERTSAHDCYIYALIVVLHDHDPIRGQRCSRGSVPTSVEIRVSASE